MVRKRIAVVSLPAVMFEVVHAVSALGDAVSTGMSMKSIDGLA